MDPDHGVAHLVQPHSGRRARPQRATLRAAAAAVQITGRASRSSSICWCQRCAPPSRLACCAKAQGCCWLLMPLPPPSCARCCRPCTGAASTRFGGAGAEGPSFRPAVEGNGKEGDGVPVARSGHTAPAARRQDRIQYRRARVGVVNRPRLRKRQTPPKRGLESRVYRATAITRCEFAFCAPRSRHQPRLARRGPDWPALESCRRRCSERPRRWAGGRSTCRQSC